LETNGGLTLSSSTVEMRGEALMLQFSLWCRKRRQFLWRFCLIVFTRLWSL